MRAGRNLWCVSLAAAVVAATLGFPRITVSADEPKAAGVATLHTATVTRGNVVATVEAVGTMEPEQVVDVGSQVCGSITDLSVDYGSQVEKGTLLAKIDDTLYVAQVEQARIGCQRADAEVALAKAKSSLAKVDWQRAQELIKHNAISSIDYDVAKYNYEVAQASIAVAEAASAQSKFALKQAEINLDWTRIRSPVKGVIIDRRVNVGQTVVSDNGVISAASLFLIAKDLKKLQVWVSVNEADIGKIRKEQTVRFTVDAYPGQSFTGKVAQIRLNATMTQEYRNLYRSRANRQRKRKITAVYDRQRAVRGPAPQGRVARAQCGPPLAAPTAVDRCRCPREGTFGLARKRSATAGTIPRLGPGREIRAAVRG